MTAKIIPLIIILVILLSGCASNTELCEIKLKCMEDIAKEHCKENDCIVIRVSNMVCGGQTEILDKRTREQIEFRFLPEEYERCGLDIK